MPIFPSGKFIETEKHCNSVISLIARLSVRKLRRQFVYKLMDVCQVLVRGCMREGHKSSASSSVKNVDRGIQVWHDDHRNLSILCPIYAFKGEAVSYVLNITLKKGGVSGSIIFVNHHALTNIDIKTRREGHHEKHDDSPSRYLQELNLKLAFAMPSSSEKS